jgi:hypothetical protein
LKNSRNFDGLLSEYKGNLFEYLVGVELAKLFQLEKEFLLSITADMSQMLLQQESFLRNYYPDLLHHLPVLAVETAQKVSHYLKLTKITQILIVGKKLAKTIGTSFAEADLIISSEGQKYPLSIKLSKMSSFVNTKSAGDKSFLKKYFIPFNSERDQEEFNNYCDLEYEQMALGMFQEVGIDYSYLFETWEDNNMPVLPGELPSQLRTYLIDYYRKIHIKLFSFLKKYYQRDKTVFVQCLWPLLGHSSDEIIQVTTFYSSGVNKQKKSNIIIKDKMDDLKVVNFESFSHSLLLKLNHGDLQLRLKPMNKFTTRAFKVNCSLKYKD